jgi:hypothetical protein
VVAPCHDINVLLTIIGAPLLAQRVPAGQVTLGGPIFGCCTVLAESSTRIGLVRRPAGR